MGVYDVDAVLPDHLAKQAEEFEVERKFLRRWSNLRVCLRAEWPGPMHRGGAHTDIILAKRISDDVYVMAHIGKRVGHFTNTGS
jgi:hypothetical protein